MSPLCKRWDNTDMARTEPAAPGDAAPDAPPAPVTAVGGRGDPLAVDPARIGREPLPVEGGLFRQTWRGPGNSGTCIYAHGEQTHLPSARRGLPALLV